MLFAGREGVEEQTRADRACTRAMACTTEANNSGGVVGSPSQRPDRCARVTAW